jgi:hypothetical protein
MSRWTTLQDGFEEIFTRTGGASSAAMCARSEPGDPVTELFFSPAAFDIAKDLILASGGIPCEKPPKDGMSYLVHDASGPDPLKSVD